MPDYEVRRDRLRKILKKRIGSFDIDLLPFECNLLNRL